MPSTTSVNSDNNSNNNKQKTNRKINHNSNSANINNNNNNNSNKKNNSQSKNNNNNNKKYNKECVAHHRRSYDPSINININNNNNSSNNNRSATKTTSTTINKKVPSITTTTTIPIRKNNIYKTTPSTPSSTTTPTTTTTTTSTSTSSTTRTTTTTSVSDTSTRNSLSTSSSKQSSSRNRIYSNPSNYLIKQLEKPQIKSNYFADINNNNNNCYNYNFIYNNNNNNNTPTGFTARLLDFAKKFAQTQFYSSDYLVRPRMDAGYYSNSYNNHHQHNLHQHNHSYTNSQPSPIYSTHSSYTTPPNSNIYSTFSSTFYYKTQHGYRPQQAQHNVQTSSSPLPHNQQHATQTQQTPPPPQPPPPPPSQPPSRPPPASSSSSSSTYPNRQYHQPGASSSTRRSTDQSRSHRYDSNYKFYNTYPSYNQYSTNHGSSAHYTKNPSAEFKFDSNIYSHFFQHYSHADRQPYSQTYAYQDGAEDIFLILEDSYDPNKLTIQMTRIRVGPDGEQQRVTIERDFRTQAELKAFLRELEEKFGKGSAGKSSSSTNKNSSKFKAHRSSSEDFIKSPGVVVVEEPGEEPKLYRQDTGELVTSSSFIDPLRRGDNNEYPYDLPKGKEKAKYPSTNQSKLYKDIDIEILEGFKKEDSHYKTKNDSNKPEISKSSTNNNNNTSSSTSHSYYRNGSGNKKEKTHNSDKRYSYREDLAKKVSTNEKLSKNSTQHDSKTSSSDTNNNQKVNNSKDIKPSSSFTINLKPYEETRKNESFTNFNKNEKSFHENKTEFNSIYQTHAKTSANGSSISTNNKTTIKNESSKNKPETINESSIVSNHVSKKDGLPSNARHRSSSINRKLKHRTFNEKDLKRPNLEKIKSYDRKPSSPSKNSTDCPTLNSSYVDSDLFVNSLKTSNNNNSSNSQDKPRTSSLRQKATINSSITPNDLINAPINLSSSYTQTPGTRVSFQPSTDFPKSNKTNYDAKVTSGSNIKRQGSLNSHHNYLLRSESVLRNEKYVKDSELSTLSYVEEVKNHSKFDSTNGVLNKSLLKSNLSKMTCKNLDSKKVTPASCDSITSSSNKSTHNHDSDNSTLEGETETCSSKHDLNSTARSLTSTKVMKQSSPLKPFNNSLSESKNISKSMDSIISNRKLNDSTKKSERKKKVIKIRKINSLNKSDEVSAKKYNTAKLKQHEISHQKDNYDNLTEISHSHECMNNQHHHHYHHYPYHQHQHQHQYQHHPDTSFNRFSSSNRSNNKYENYKIPSENKSLNQTAMENEEEDDDDDDDDDDEEEEVNDQKYEVRKDFECYNYEYCYYNLNPPNEQQNLYATQNQVYDFRYQQASPAFFQPDMYNRASMRIKVNSKPDLVSTDATHNTPFPIYQQHQQYHIHNYNQQQQQQPQPQQQHQHQHTTNTQQYLLRTHQQQPSYYASWYGSTPSLRVQPKAQNRQSSYFN